MYSRAMSHCASLSAWRVLFFGAVLAVSFEAFSVWTRFGLGLQSTRDTTAIARLTLGLRIHHGYVGILLAFVAGAYVRNSRGLRNALFMIAVALIVSDLFHHFLVLWPITGSPQFDLVYPAPKE